MQHLEIPDPVVWKARKEWYEKHIFEYEEAGSYLVGEQASALLFDVQSCFCVGAWVSVILVSYSVIEAHLRETNPKSKKRNLSSCFKKRDGKQRLRSCEKLEIALYMLLMMIRH